MAPSSGELWGHHLMPSMLEVDCLMPTGIIVMLKCARDATLASVKTNLWKEAKKYPLFYLLSDPSAYIFVSVTQDADIEEFYDETRRLCDLHLFQPVLKIVEPKGNKEEKILNSEISNAIGVPESEFSKVKELEVMTFRRSILRTCQEAIQLRDSQGSFGRALYFFPPVMHESEELPPNLADQLENEPSMIVCIWVVSSGEDSEKKYSVKVPHYCSPEQVIAEAIRKRAVQMNFGTQEVQKCVQEYQDSYVLKVCGCNEYLLEKYPLSQYKYVRKCLMRGLKPQLMLMSKEGFLNNLPQNVFSVPSYVKQGVSALTDIAKQPTQSLWNLEGNLRIRINCATYVNIREIANFKIYVKTCIYHGMEPLCPAVCTQPVESSNPRWGEWLEYDLLLVDVPRSARLALSLCCVAKKHKSGKKDDYALGWANINVFDFNGRLQSEKASLHLWPIPQGHDDLLYPIGVPGSNPNSDSQCLELEFQKFAFPVSFPHEDHIQKYAAFLESDENPNYTKLCISERDESSLWEIVERDPLADISEQEKELIWEYRHVCVTRPDSLPKLLAAVRWNSRDHVTQLYALLHQWPVCLQPQTCLELLYCTYTDLTVRHFAVHCMESNLNDEHIAKYLLQLVQVLKFEPYLENPLAQFLLKRALLNRRIGHFFFWHLRCEMWQPQLRLRFGLLLESYCRSCGAYLKSLCRQVDAVEKLTTLTEALKAEKDEQQARFLTSQVMQADYRETLQDLPSPLNHSIILGELLVKECKVMSSKKRPLWLSWSNPDRMSHLMQARVQIIFKNGDDLRQDMLTLQVISIMDNIWQNEGLDLRMTPYGCIATGQHIGLIECVRDCKTVMKIMAQRGLTAAMQFDSKELHRWLKEMNKGDKYDQAIDTFTRSCAGYCVATFILGIGDRHPDNIMLNTEGQVFHIDFGHFLDHRKMKWKWKRERTPFVLPEDFIRVIAKGADNPTKSVEFKAFQQLCYRSYLCLRKHAHLIVTLFVLLLSCGIPQLQSLDDIEYIRKSLQVESTEEEALRYFQKQLDAAHSGSMATKFDWFFHGVKHHGTAKHN